MSNIKKAVALILAAAMVFALAACTGGGSTSGTTAADGGSTSGTTAADGGQSETTLDTSKEVEIVMYFISDRPAGQDIVDENMNKLFKEKLNCTLQVNWIPWSDYSSTYNLKLSSGEPIDLIYTAGWLGYSKLAQQGAFMALDDLWPKYAPKNYAKATDQAKQQATVDGHIYTIPTLWATYISQGPIYRTDILKGSDLEGLEIKTFDDIEKYCDYCLEKYPEILPMDIYQNGSAWDAMWARQLGYQLIGNEAGNFYFNLDEENPKVISIDEIPGIEDFLNMMKRWNEKGYFSKTCLSITDSQQCQNGKAFIRCHNIDSYQGLMIDAYNKKNGWEWAYSDFNKYAAHLPFTQDSVSVSINSKNPERALALWDLITSDQEAYDAFYYGIEGTTYKLEEDGSAVMLDPDLYSTSGMWTVRTTGLTRKTVGSPAGWDEWHEKWEEMIAKDDTQEKYSAIVIDTTGLDTEIANVTDVYNKYWTPLELALNTNGVEGGLEEFREQLKIAGADKIKEAYQKQLDEYVANLKK